MSVEDEDPQVILERQIDALFEAADKAAFFILDQVVEIVRCKPGQQFEPGQDHPTQTQ